jgi:hypothetical protein
MTNYFETGVLRSPGWPAVAGHDSNGCASHLFETLRFSFTTPIIVIPGECEARGKGIQAMGTNGFEILREIFGFVRPDRLDPLSLASLGRG